MTRPMPLLPWAVLVLIHDPGSAAVLIRARARRPFLKGRLVATEQRLLMLASPLRCPHSRCRSGRRGMLATATHYRTLPISTLQRVMPRSQPVLQLVGTPTLYKGAYQPYPRSYLA